MQLIEPLQVGCGVGGSKREGGGESSCTVGIAADRALIQVGCGDGGSKREGGDESSCRNCSYRALTSWLAMETVRGWAEMKAAVGIAADRTLTSWVWRWRQ